MLHSNIQQTFFLILSMHTVVILQAGGMEGLFKKKRKE